MGKKQLSDGDTLRLMFCFLNCYSKSLYYNLGYKSVRGTKSTKVEVEITDGTVLNLYICFASVRIKIVMDLGCTRKFSVCLLATGF